MVAAFLMLHRRQSLWADIVSGAILALATALKPNVGLVVVAVVLAWIGNSLWRTLLNVGVGLAMGALMAVGLPAVLFPSATWRNWAGVVPALISSIQPLELGNFSFSAIIVKQGGHNVSVLLLALGLLILGAAALSPLWSEHPTGSERRESFRRTFFSVSAGALLILLSSRLVWIHYVILATPALVLFFQSLMEQHQVSVNLLIGVAVLPITSGFTAVLEILGTRTLWIAVAMNLSLFMLFIFCTISLWRSDERDKVW